ncbi:TPA: glycine cleavage system protein GcvH [Candidatus Bathyarchaeota archaeon]|nr:glycine cleavage system protein GcvH [Candidatus Bathyarchaeota archaeon]
MKVGDYEVLEDLYYTEEHEWLKIEGELCRMGLCDYAQKSLHEIVFVELPKVGAKVSQMESVGSVESVKAVADVFSPVSGEIVEVNAKLEDSPELINESPYGEGWIAVLKPSNLQEEVKNLMDAKAYAEFLKSIVEKEQT